MDFPGKARGSKSARTGESPDRAAGQSRAVAARPGGSRGGKSERPHWRCRRSTGEMTHHHMAKARAADSELQLVCPLSEMHTGLLLRCGTADGQAISKKRERQVGEAQGALVVAQAQVSGLEMQLQELTAAQKQASAQHTLFDLKYATTQEHSNSRPAHSSFTWLFGIARRVQKPTQWPTAVSWRNCAQPWRPLSPKPPDTITPSRSPAHRLRHAAACLCTCHSMLLQAAAEPDAMSIQAYGRRPSYVWHAQQWQLPHAGSSGTAAESRADCLRPCPGEQ